MFDYLPSFVHTGDNLLRRWFKVITSVPRTRLLEILLFGATILFFVFSLSAFFFSLSPKKAAADGLMVFAPATVSSAPLFPLEMHIANSGLVLLHNARVVAVSGTTVTVSTAWGSTDFKWEVLTNGSTYGTRIFGTRFLNRNGQELSLQDIHVGDFVTITGMLDTTAQDPTIEADAVRNMDE